MVKLEMPMEDTIRVILDVGEYGGPKGIDSQEFASGTGRGEAVACQDVSKWVENGVDGSGLPIEDAIHVDLNTSKGGGSRGVESRRFAKGGDEGESLGLWFAAFCINVENEVEEVELPAGDVIRVPCGTDRDGARVWDVV